MERKITLVASNDGWHTYTHTYNLGGCTNNAHSWHWSWDGEREPPEGLPCLCGMMVYHSEKCKECGQTVVKPQPNPNFNANATLPTS